MSDGYEQGLMASAETAFHRATFLDEVMVDASARLEELGAQVSDARATFFAEGDRLLTSDDPSFAERFETEDEYYGFLARMGTDPTRKPYDRVGTTAKVAEAIRLLHTPGTPAFLKTRVRGNHLLGTQYAVGRVHDAHVALIPSSRLSPYQSDLVVVTRTDTVNGELASSEAGVDDIALRFDRSVGPGTATPLVAVGQAAVRKQLESVYFDRETHRGHDWSARNSIMTAVCMGGLKLSELGIEEDTIAARRALLVENLSHVRHYGGRYEDEVVALAAFYPTNAATLAAVDHVLGDANLYGIGSSLARDYRTLKDAQAPEPTAA